MPGAEPSISVVVTTRDRPRLLADALASVGAQNRPPLEVRLAHQGAPLGALPTLGVELVVVATRAGQPGRARNEAAAGARGDVLAFLDDDDMWRPGHLAALAGAFEDPAVGFAYDDCEVVRERIAPSGRRETLERRRIAHGWDEALARRDDYLPPSGWGVRRDLFERLGGFDAGFAYSEDWDFLLRAARLTTPRRVAGVGVEVRLREPGDSSAAAGNASSAAGPERLDCLARLAARHGLAPIEPKTFWDVAGAVMAARGAVERR